MGTSNTSKSVNLSNSRILMHSRRANRQPGPPVTMSSVRHCRSSARSRAKQWICARDSECSMWRQVMAMPRLLPRAADAMFVLRTMYPHYSIAPRNVRRRNASTLSSVQLTPKHYLFQMRVSTPSSLPSAWCSHRVTNSPRRHKVFSAPGGVAQRNEKLGPCTDPLHHRALYLVQCATNRTRDLRRGRHASVVQVRTEQRNAHRGGFDDVC